MGLLRPSFVPPPEIRALRDLTRTRLQLVRDRTREWQRLEKLLEKLLEGALVKLSSVVSSLAAAKSARKILEALARGETDPAALAALAHGNLGGARRRQAGTGGHAARPAPPRADPAPPGRRDRRRPGRHPRARGITADGVPSPDPAALAAAERLAEIPGVSLQLAMAVIAETGLDMTRFPAAAHLVSWAGLAPVARQSGPRSRKPKKGQGNDYLKGYCTQAATGTARTATFLGERYRRLHRRIGGVRAQCAVARSILVIVWHLLSDPAARFADLGPDWHTPKPTATARSAPT
jgi:transposase